MQFLQHFFPKELTEYFDVSSYGILCDIALKEEYWVIDFEEKNILPEGFSRVDYESKGFMESKLIQDFPIRGKAVYLRIKLRRWQHKVGKEIIRRDFSFIAQGAKFTEELSAFLKGANPYATRYHEEHSQLLRD